MRKRFTVLVVLAMIIALLSACNVWTAPQEPENTESSVTTAVVEEPSVETDNAFYDSGVEKTSVEIPHELILREWDSMISEEYRPYITFYSDMHCELLVNMMEWTAEITADYEVYEYDSGALVILCDLGSTEFVNSLNRTNTVFYLVRSSDDCWVFLDEGLGIMLAGDELCPADATVIQAERQLKYTLNDEEIYQRLTLYYEEINSESAGDTTIVLEGESSDTAFSTQVRCGVPGNPYATQPLYWVTVYKTTGLVVEEHMISSKVSYYILTDRTGE